MVTIRRLTRQIVLIVTSGKREWRGRKIKNFEITLVNNTSFSCTAASFEICIL